MLKQAIDNSIHKLLRTRDQDWCMRRLVDEHGRHCALGHLSPFNHIGGLCRDDYITICIAYVVFYNFNLPTINDGVCSEKLYNLRNTTTPRQRVIASLEVMRDTEKPEGFIQFLHFLVAAAQQDAAIMNHVKLSEEQKLYAERNFNTFLQRLCESEAGEASGEDDITSLLAAARELESQTVDDGGKGNNNATLAHLEPVPTLA